MKRFLFMVLLVDIVYGIPVEVVKPLSCSCSEGYNYDPAQNLCVTDCDSGPEGHGLCHHTTGTQESCNCPEGYIAGRFEYGGHPNPILCLKCTSGHLLPAIPNQDQFQKECSA